MNDMRIRTHPGEVLYEEFMKPLHISPQFLAEEIQVPEEVIHGIIQKKKDISPATGARLARFFGTTPQFWLNLQAAYSLSIVEVRDHAILERIAPYNMNEHEMEHESYIEDTPAHRHSM